MSAKEPADEPPQTPPAKIDPFATRTPWSPDGAIAFTLLAITVAVVATTVFQAISFRLSRWLFGQSVLFPTEHVTLGNAMMITLVLEALIILIVLWAAARAGGVRRTVLSLPSRLPLRTFAIGLGLFAALVLPIHAVKFALWPETYATDLRMFAAYRGSPALWLAALVVVVGAPLSEELLFRGFLLPALTKMKRGFPAAALVSTAGWTFLHFDYSLTGLIEVFLIGLLFCWLVYTTGNLWLTIVLHALYNAVQLLAIALWPGGLAGG